MAISPHVARLRALVGHDELLHLPGVCVVPVDTLGRVLLVRHSDGGVWGLLGGGIEVDERPETAAIRETIEETGVRPTLTRLLGAFGGPEYRVEYANGDKASFVVTAYEASIEHGEPQPDGEEVTELGWFDPFELSAADLNPLARTLLHEAGYLPTEQSSGEPGGHVRGPVADSDGGGDDPGDGAT